MFTEVPIPEAYTSRKILVSYQSASNIIARRVWFTGFVPEHAPVRRLRFAFPEQMAAGIRVVQTNTAPGSWTIHEVRAFDGPRELSRAGWRATAQPYTLGNRSRSRQQAHQFLDVRAKVNSRPVRPIRLSRGGADHRLGRDRNVAGSAGDWRGPGDAR